MNRCGTSKQRHLSGGNSSVHAPAMAPRLKPTRQPSAVAMSTSASIEKRDARPRSESLIRG